MGSEAGKPGHRGQAFCKGSFRWWGYFYSYSHKFRMLAGTIFASLEQVDTFYRCILTPVELQREKCKTSLSYVQSSKWQKCRMWRGRQNIHSPLLPLWNSCISLFPFFQINILVKVIFYMHLIWKRLPTLLCWLIGRQTKCAVSPLLMRIFWACCDFITVVHSC